jgi:hypothetical protein
MRVAMVVVAAVIVLRILLWIKFRNTRSGKRLLVSSFQLLVVIATAVAYEATGGNHALILVSIALGLVAAAGGPPKHSPNLWVPPF